MYSIEGIKLSKADVEVYRAIKTSSDGKNNWWSEIKQRYGLDTHKKYKIRFVALIIESRQDG